PMVAAMVAVVVLRLGSTEDTLERSTRMVQQTGPKRPMPIKNMKDMKDCACSLERMMYTFCPGDYEWVTGDCYKSVRAVYKRTWEQARMYCQAVDGDLATIGDFPPFTEYYNN
ncbi:unnamed protein product, partial [Meganyctiphanes norvegica]